MLKTAIITWNSYYNYGTCLQAYALQHYIESLGHENHIIDDSSIVSPIPSSQKPPSQKDKWLMRVKKLFQSLHANYRTYYKFQRILCPAVNSFKKDKLKIDYDINSVLSDESDYEVYICGSDQIWNSRSLADARKTFYYAAFTAKNKISYAPSIGLYQIAPDRRKQVAELIAPFSALSVREDAGRKALQELTETPVELVADPTLLLSQQEWELALPGKQRKKEKYVLGYILTPNDTYYKIAREYARQHKMKFYLFMLNLQDYGHADKLISGGPLDFLEYVRNATVVFTDSFHCTIFSMIFEVPFYTLKRFSDDSPINQNSRIDTLLKGMGAEARLIDSQRTEPLNDDALDFAEMKHRMEPLIEHSKAYLQRHLSAIAEEKRQ